MRVTARVVDEQGNPLVGVPVRIGIHNVNDFLDEYNDFYGKSDEQGRFSAEAVGRPLAKIEIKADGYYPSLKTVSCNEGSAELIRKGGRYLPWDPVVDVMIKKVGSPIPMIVRRGNRCRSWVEPRQGHMNKALGWDLVEGDWVAPHGNGKRADLIFRFESSYSNEESKSAQVCIKFANPGDGFIAIHELKGEESLLKYPRMAPIEGYENKQVDLLTKVFEDWRLVKNRPRGYFLKLRSEMDASGKTLSAIYGKITEPFKLYPPSVSYRLPVLNFDYYVNPTPNDRNLEYDQRTNLAPEADRGLIWPP